MVEGRIEATVFLSYPLGTRRGRFVGDLIAEALRDLDIVPQDARAFQPASGPIHTWTVRAIAGADLVIADITEGTPNVFYELGLASGTGKPAILLTERPASAPLDVSAHPLIVYSLPKSNGEPEFRKETVIRLRDTVRRVLPGALTPTDFDIAPPREHVIVEFSGGLVSPDALVVLTAFAEGIREVVPGTVITRLRTSSPLLSWFGIGARAASIGRAITKRFSTKDLRDAEAERARAEAELARAKTEAVRHETIRDDEWAALAIYGKSLELAQQVKELDLGPTAITVGGEARITIDGTGGVRVKRPSSNELGTPADQLQAPDVDDD